ncbi:MAG: hypothetical protein IPK54_04515 [Dokdonella sp.]|uniref:hypothetical protein n=1 Tax=Dokdonella sp. TaxID=2291710 RepID=UPI0025B977B2|nr:hypothetical protein [Dokdonella sp.]MBK8122815.1 hypothetical protein [Dokdonella sp.]
MKSNSAVSAMSALDAKRFNENSFRGHKENDSRSMKRSCNMFKRQTVPETKKTPASGGFS